MTLIHRHPEEEGGPAMKAHHATAALSSLIILAASLVLTAAPAAAQSLATSLGLEANIPTSAWLDQEGPDYILSETLIADMISFAPNKDQAPGAQKDTLKRLARLIQERPGADLEIHGYADATEPNPESLSLKRAQRVREVLIGYGVPAQHIQEKAHGDDEPAGDATLNRRVEFKLMTKIGFDEQIGFSHGEDTPLDGVSLDLVAERLQKHEFVRLRILGHAAPDEGAAASDRDQLGLDRAAAIRRALIARGVPASRLSIVSLGDRAHKRAERPDNRRVSFRMVFP
jgi:outer membrane protein OmpA-like peptidoglycan-associated protein